MAAAAWDWECTSAAQQVCSAFTPSLFLSSLNYPSIHSFVGPLIHDLFPIHLYTLTSIAPSILALIHPSTHVFMLPTLLPPTNRHPSIDSSTNQIFFSSTLPCIYQVTVYPSIHPPIHLAPPIPPSPHLFTIPSILLFAHPSALLSMHTSIPHYQSVHPFPSLSTHHFSYLSTKRLPFHHPSTHTYCTFSPSPHPALILTFSHPPTQVSLIHTSFYQDQTNRIPFTKLTCLSSVKLMYADLPKVRVCEKESELTQTESVQENHQLSLFYMIRFQQPF